MPFADFFVAYGEDPARETVLAPGEIVTAITVQATPAGRLSTYRKVRDRQSYAYAVVSAAVALEMDGDTVTAARVSLGRTLTEAIALEAGAAVFADARPLRHNAFKVELGRRTVAAAALTASKRN